MTAAERAASRAATRAGPAFHAGIPALVALLACLCRGHLPSIAAFALAVIAGLPHGGFDWDIARARFAADGSAWRGRFLVPYVGLICATMVAWRIAPVATLGGFLALSVVHFGRQDAEAPDANPLAIAAHGLAPIVVPAVCQPAGFAQILGILVGDAAPALCHLIAGPLAWGWLGAVMAGVFVRGRAAPLALLDLAGVIALFALAPPLIAFAGYFALIHAPRAYAALPSALSGDPGARTRAALAVAGGLAIGAALFVLGPTGPVDDRVIRAGFILLSALTVPHMWLDHTYRRPRPGEAVAASANHLPA